MIRVAVLMGGRSSEHDISIASARSVIAALDPARYETVTVEIGRDGAWELGEGSRRALDKESGGTLPVPSSGGAVMRTLADVEVVLPDPPRPLRRGRDRPRAARARRYPVRRSGCRRLGRLHGQGSDEGRPARERHPRYAQRHATGRRRAGAPVRLPRVREAGAARLVGGNLEGDHGRRPGRSGRPLRGATTRRCSSRRRRRESRSSAASSETSSRSPRCRARSSRTASPARTGTTTRRSTTTAAWSCSSRRASPSAQPNASRRCPSAAFVATECEGMARVDCFVTDDGDVLVNELNTIPGFTADERLRQAVRGVRHRVSRAPRSADRARARTPRAALEARVLGGLVARRWRRPRGNRLKHLHGDRRILAQQPLEVRRREDQHPDR